MGINDPPFNARRVHRSRPLALRSSSLCLLMVLGNVRVSLVDHPNVLRRLTRFVVD
jgi:hypothetical protein